jgi:SAM-dependent methyltransferase
MSILERWRLRREFDMRGPWVSRFVIDGHTYGGDLPYADDFRIRQFRDAFPDARSILEPGCLEGALSFQLAKVIGSQIVAVDARPENLERARFIKRLLGIDNVEFVRADLEQTPLSSFGQFDAIFCSGLLYHLPRPWEFLDGLRGASPRVLLWTHYAYGAEIRDDANGYRGFRYTEKGIDDPRSGVSPHSFFMRLDDIVEGLKTNGYDRVEIVDDRPHHEPHACVTLVAEARGPAPTGG